MKKDENKTRTDQNRAEDLEALNDDAGGIQILKAANREDLKIVEELARVIWREHYTPIIGPEQVAYMLDNFQSVPAMEEQIGEGMEYYRINLDELPVGYLAFKKQGEELFLSKIYVLSSRRGQGIGKKAMRFAESKALELSCHFLSLTVNKNNSGAIKAYEKMGFVNHGAIETDIGSGFIMDDYLMKKIL